MHWNIALDYAALQIIVYLPQLLTPPLSASHAVGAKLLNYLNEAPRQICPPSFVLELNVAWGRRKGVDGGRRQLAAGRQLGRRGSPSSKKQHAATGQLLLLGPRPGY